MSLKEQIQQDIKVAMRAKEMARLTTLRMLSAEIKNVEINQRIETDDAAVLAVINKMLKQRRDSFEQYQQAGRNELAEKEQQEIQILKHYLPQQLSSAEIETAVSTAIEQTGATGPQDMGKVMALLKPQLVGKADMAQVSAAIKAALSR